MGCTFQASDFTPQNEVESNGVDLLKELKQRKAELPRSADLPKITSTMKSSMSSLMGNG